ncbi:MAG: hypothetical protein WCK26_00145 [Candidatus Saccharibacteria bacterium]
MPDENKDIEQQPVVNTQENNFSNDSMSEKPATSIDGYSPAVQQPVPVLQNDTTPITPVEPSFNPTATQDNSVSMAEPLTNMATTQPMVTSTKPAGPNWLKNKKLIIGLVIAFTIVLIGGGTTLAYTSWYQNPKKVLADAVINMVTAKTSIYTGKFTMNMDDRYSEKMNIEVNVDAKQADATGSVDVGFKIVYSGKTFQLSGSGLYDSKGDLYVKVQDLKSIVAELKTTLGSGMPQSVIDAIDKFVNKIDGVWIRVSSDDMKTYSDSYSTTQKCLNKAVDNFKKNQNDTKEVTNLYQKNQFIAIDDELGETNGSSGYLLSLNYTALKSFAKGFKSTKIYTDLKACDSSFNIDEEQIQEPEKSSDDTSEVTNKIWISTWGHQITKFETKVSGKGEYSKNLALLTVEPKFNQTVTVSAPKDFITLTDLQTYIEEMYDSIYSSYEASINDTSYDTNSDYPAASSIDSTKNGNVFDILLNQFTNKP